MLIRENTVQQINAALLSLSKELEKRNNDLRIESEQWKKDVQRMQQVQSNWEENDPDKVDYIRNKPVLADVATSGSYYDLTNRPTLSPVATSGNYNELINKPTIPSALSQLSNDVGYTTTNYVTNNFVLKSTTINNKALTSNITLDASDVGALPDNTHIPEDPVQADWTETDNTELSFIKNKPTLATVATTGDYNDLINTPSAPLAQVNSDWNATSGVAEILNKPNLATIATSGDYDDLSNKPTIPTVDDSVTSGNMNAVTSNAVALAISEGIKRKWTETSAPVTGTNASNITWTCIETNGGLKICFGRATAIRSSSPTGNIFYSAGADEQWYYPSNFFTATPTCLMEASGDSQWILTYTQPQGADKTKTKKVCPACSLAFSNLTIYYDIAAFGV